jgi:hypothetical protein
MKHIKHYENVDFTRNTRDGEITDVVKPKNVDFEQEDIEYYNEIKSRIQNSIEYSLYEASGDMDDYTINVAGEIDIIGVITSDYGDYEYSIKIKRTI